MSRSLRYLQIFQGKKSGKIPPIDFNRSEISDIVRISPKFLMFLQRVDVEKKLQPFRHITKKLFQKH